MVTFAALQIIISVICCRTRATRISQTPVAQGAAPRGTLCAALSVWAPAGLILTAVELTAQSRRSVSTGRRRSLLQSLHNHCSQTPSRLCLTWQLQLMALSSVQLSSTHHNACAAVPWAFAINFDADAETICSLIM